MLFAVFVLAPQSAWALMCAPERAPQIDISSSEEPLVIIENRSFTALSKARTNTINPYAPGTISHTFGLAHRKFAMQHRVEYKMYTNPRTRKTCYIVYKIDIKMNMKPTIYIAKEYPRGSCHYDHVMAHEQEHIAVDRNFTDSYLAEVKKKLSQLIRTKQVYGPVRESMKSATTRQLQRDIERKIKAVLDVMEKERDAEQAKIDSLESYERSSQYIRSVCDVRQPHIAEARNAILRRLYQ